MASPDLLPAHAPDTGGTGLRGPVPPAYVFENGQLRVRLVYDNTLCRAPAAGLDQALLALGHELARPPAAGPLAAALPLLALARSQATPDWGAGLGAELAALEPVCLAYRPAWREGPTAVAHDLCAAQELLASLLALVRPTCRREADLEFALLDTDDGAPAPAGAAEVCAALNAHLQPWGVVSRRARAWLSAVEHGRAAPSPPAAQSSQWQPQADLEFGVPGWLWEAAPGGTAPTAACLAVSQLACDFLLAEHFKSLTLAAGRPLGQATRNGPRLRASSLADNGQLLPCAEDGALQRAADLWLTFSELFLVLRAAVAKSACASVGSAAAVMALHAALPAVRRCQNLLLRLGLDLRVRKSWLVVLAELQQAWCAAGCTHPPQAWCDLVQVAVNSLPVALCPAVRGRCARKRQALGVRQGPPGRLFLPLLPGVGSRQREVWFVPRARRREGGRSRRPERRRAHFALFHTPGYEACFIPVRNSVPHQFSPGESTGGMLLTGLRRALAGLRGLVCLEDEDTAFFGADGTATRPCVRGHVVLAPRSAPGEVELPPLPLSPGHALPASGQGAVSVNGRRRGIMACALVARQEIPGRSQGLAEPGAGTASACLVVDARASYEELLVSPVALPTRDGLDVFYALAQADAPGSSGARAQRTPPSPHTAGLD